MVDKTVGLIALSAILGALFARERTGQGQALEVPMFESMAAFVLVEHMYGHVFEPPIGTARYPRLMTENRRPYRTADGFVSVLAYTDEHWRRLFEAIQRRELIAADRFSDMTARNENIDELYAIIAAAMPSRTTAEWLAILNAADLPAMPVNSIEQVLEDPHIADVGLLKTVEHPSEGSIRVISNPVNWIGAEAAPLRPAPRLGEHTCEILAEVGLESAEIDRLLSSGAVARSEPVS